jgi:hypothetical protein
VDDLLRSIRTRHFGLPLVYRGRVGEMDTWLEQQEDNCWRASALEFISPAPFACQGRFTKQKFGGGKYCSNRVGLLRARGSVV